MATNAPTDGVKITAGPSAGEIWDSAKYAYTDRWFSVVFTGVKTVNGVSSDVRLTTYVRGATHDDGSGHSLVIKTRSGKQLYYNARTRQGFIDIHQ